MPDARLESPSVARAASISLRIIAAAIIIACINYASSVVITLIFSIFIAFVLEPGVRWLERIRVPRWLGSLIMVVAALGLVYLVIYALYNQLIAFAHDFPTYAEPLKRLLQSFERFVGRLQQSTSTIMPAAQQPGLPTIRLQQESPWAHYLLRGIGSIYSFAVTVMFIPFLVFFMLAGKDQIWASSLNLFPREHRYHAETVIHSIGHMVREYVLGNILVALISAALITPIFGLIHLRYALLMGPLAALLSLIPYLGVALGLVPPLMIALTIQRHHPLCGDWRDGDGGSLSSHQRLHTQIGGASRQAECLDRDHFNDVLGVALGRLWFDSRRAYHGGVQSGVRQRGEAQALGRLDGRPIARCRARPRPISLTLRALPGFALTPGGALPSPRLLGTFGSLQSPPRRAPNTPPRAPPSPPQ